MLFAGCAGVVVAAGVVVCPNRLGVAAGAAGLAPRPPPNRLVPLPAGLDASAGGAPAGVVEPRPPNKGFAGVAVAPDAPVPVFPEENNEDPVLPKSPGPVEAVFAPGATAVVAAVVVAVLFPNRLGVPVGVAVPDAGVEVLPNRFPPAGLLVLPNNPPAAGAPVV